MEHCGITLVEAPEGRAWTVAEAEGPLTNSRGFAHGGLLMTMLDIAMGHAARDAVDGAASFATIDLQIAFLHPGSGRLKAEGRVLRPGKSVVFCEGDVRDAEGTLVANATGIFRPIFPK